MRVVICVVLTVACIAHAYKVLVVFPSSAHSHYTIGHALSKALAERGHEVTFITPLEKSESTHNLKIVVLKDMMKAIQEVQKDQNVFDTLYIPASAMILLLGYFGIMGCNLTFSDAAMQTLLQSDETYDAVITESFVGEPLQGLAHHFKAHSILVSTIGPNIWGDHMMGTPEVYSYMAHPFTGYTHRMDFWQRLNNFLIIVLQKLFYNLYYIPEQDALMHKYLPDVPSLREIMADTRLHLYNSDIAFGTPKLLLPNMVEIGGFHIQPPKKLPKDLQEYLDSSKEGVIYFSMGGNLKSKDMAETTKNDLLKVFAKLKMNVLWKFEDDLPGKPKNVEIRKWLPQSDLLAHPNVILFITHGGLLSTMESLYHGVPVIGIPVFGDQGLNMKQAVAEGYGIEVPYNQLNENTLSKALDAMFSNSTYKENALRISSLIKDKQVQQTDKATYWIEYVIRHKGATHLKTPAHYLNWFQYYSLDVIVFLLLVMLVALKITCVIFRKLFCRKKNQKQKLN